MKPRNKFQARVVEVSKKLPKLTKTQIEWAYDNVIEHIGQRTAKGKITCTKYGYAWQGHRVNLHPLRTYLSTLQG